MKKTVAFSKNAAFAPGNVGRIVWMGKAVFAGRPKKLSSTAHNPITVKRFHWWEGVDPVPSFFPIAISDAYFARTGLSLIQGTVKKSRTPSWPI